jgi:putative transposase
MDAALRLRAYPEEGTASEAWRHIDIHRQIRNDAVRDYYNHPPGDRPTAYTQHKRLTKWKQDYPLYKEVSAHAAQQTVSQIHNDIKTLHERRKQGYDVGRLRWQSTGEFRSVAYQSEGFDVNHNTGPDEYVTLTLSKIGSFPVRAHRPVPNTDDIKRVVLKKEQTGEWYVSLITDIDEDELPEKPAVDDLDVEDCVGIDLGILSYIHTSDNLAVDSLTLDAEYERCAREQRRLARKEHGSRNWERQRCRVADAKRRIRRKVLDFQHKLSTWLVREYDLVAVEDLDVKPMLEDSHNARNKQDAAWSRFLRLLEYKGELYGTHVVSVDPAGTSKECSACGVETAKPVWVREHSCPACGHEEDRDLNAARNVLSRGLEKLGQGLSEATPVETAPAASPDSGSERVDARRVIEAGSVGG